jgi:hypothetical protein
MSTSQSRRAFGALSLFAVIAAAAVQASAHESPVHKPRAAPVAKIAANATSTSGEPSLAEVRQLTDHFRDVNVALAEGYIRDPGDMCDTAEMMGKPAALGAMGIHFFRPDLLGITAPPNPRVDGTGTHTDFRKPAILVYEPQADGSLELVAVENLVFRKSWHSAGNSGIPSFHGVAYDTMADDPITPIDEAHMFEPHYDRHVWIYRENPNGVFAQYNPNVSCQHHNSGSHKRASR